MEDFLKGRSYHYGDFCADSRQLEELRTQDNSSIKREIAREFSEDPPPPVPVNVIDRSCKETAELYVRKPIRSFEGLSSAQERALVRLFRRVKWDLRMQEAAERLVSQNSVIASVDIGRRIGRPCVRTWLPYQFRVFFDDPARATESIQEADRVEIRVPVHVHHEEQTDTVHFGLRVYTPTEAWLEPPQADSDAEPQRIPLIGDSIVHNLGYIPLAGMRRVSPQEGVWVPPLPHDMLCVHIATAMGISDWHHIARYQIYSEEHWKGEGAAKVAQEQATSPRFVAGWDVDEGDKLEHEIVERDPKLEKYIQVVEKTLELYAANRSISRTALTESSGITGDAKAEERADQERERQRMEQVCAAFEEEALQVLVDIERIDGRSPLFRTPLMPEVTIKYHYVPVRGNKLQDAQAKSVLCELDLDSPEEIEARDEGVPLEDAIKTVESRRARRLARQPQQPSSTPGLNRLAPEEAG